MFAAALVLGFLFVGVNSQGAVSVGVNSDGSSSLSGRVPIAANDKVQLSAFGSIAQPTGDITKGLSLDTA